MAEGSTDRITQPTDADVTAYLDGVTDERRRDDARAVVALMRDVTGALPRMWGTTTIGFGRQPSRLREATRSDL